MQPGCEIKVKDMHSSQGKALLTCVQMFPAFATFALPTTNLLCHLPTHSPQNV